MTRSSCPSAVFAVALLFTPLLSAQTRDDGALWLAWVAQGRFGAADTGLADWRWWLDVQERQRDEGEHFDLGIVRPAVGYVVHDRITLHGGYAWIPTDPLRRDEFVEHRAWQQVTWNVPLFGQDVQARTRLEQRFLETDGDTGWRLREFLKTTVPLVDDRRWFVSLWDELLWDLGDTAWGQRQGFRQNRAFAGLGTFLDGGRRVSLEVGYLNQWIDRPGEDRLNHILSVTLFTVF
jgi:hypothetical protein